MQRNSASVLRPALELLWAEADSAAKRLVFFSLLLGLASSVVAGLVPLFLKAAIDAFEPNTTLNVYSALFYLIAAYVLANWLARSLIELHNMYYGRADRRVHRRLSSKLFEHVISLPLRFHLDRKTGALSQTLTNGLLGYRLLLFHIMQTVLPVSVELITMGAVLLVLDHAEFLVIISISLLAYSLAFWAGISRIGGPARSASSAHIDANAILTDSILNYETVKYFVAEGRVHGRFGEALAKTEGHWTELFKCKMQNGLVLAAIFSLSLGVSVIVAARQVQQGSMSIGEFVLVNTYVLQISRPLEMIGFAFRDIAQGTAFIEKMVELFRQKSEVTAIERRTIFPSGPPALAFKQVSFEYDPNRCILKEVNFNVPAGKTVAIVGASGSGKSSLIRLLVRLVEPSRGQILLNSAPISNIALSVLRNAIAVVPQDIALFNDSIAYNIGFGKQDSTEAEIIAAAKVAHIHDFISKLPDGYETKVGERGVKLSGGEKQRIAFARATIKKPKIFVFDEATSSLDSDTERAILCDLIEIAKMTTTLIIAHRLSTVIHADEIIVLGQGSIVEKGTHDDLLMRGGSYATMWYTQNGRTQQHGDHASSS